MLITESFTRYEAVRRDREEARGLSTDGIYARSRHPMYGTVIILRLAREPIERPDALLSFHTTRVPYKLLTRNETMIYRKNK